MEPLSEIQGGLGIGLCPLIAELAGRGFLDGAILQSARPVEGGIQITICPLRNNRGDHSVPLLALGQGSRPGECGLRVFLAPGGGNGLQGLAALLAG